MATEITTFLDSEYNLTSSVYAIKARTDKDKVAVRLDCENGVNGDIETFYSTTLYAFNGIVELVDVGSLIEEYFRLRHRVADMISISIDDTSVDGVFLYCEYAVDPDFDPGTRLFLATNSQRVHQDSTVTFASSDHGSAFPFTIKAVGHREIDGILAAVSFNLPVKLSNNSALFDVSDIIRYAMNAGGIEMGDDALIDVLYFSIEYGNLQKLCYIVPAKAYLTFAFSNNFNVTEYIDIVGTITTKTETSRETAVCSGVATQYDRNVTRTFQVETEPIPTEEVPLFEQFLSSHSVELTTHAYDFSVIITEFTSEPSNDDGSLTTFKFSWRFVNNRPVLFESLVNGIMPNRHRIFDDKFSPEYD